MHRCRFAALVTALAAVVVLAGCGRGNDDAPTPAPIRTPVPTFTPTAPVPQAATELQAVAAPAAPAPDAQAEAAQPAPELAASPAAAPAVAEQPGVGGPVDAAAIAAAPVQPAIGVVNTELVNSRTGPDITFPVVMVLGRGEQYDVTGKSADGAWWRMCCIEGKEVWTKAEYVDTDGLTDALPVAQAGEISSVALARITATADASNQEQAALQEAAQPAAPPAPENTPAPVPVAEAPAPQAAAPAAPQAEAAAQPQAVDAPAAVAAAEVMGFALTAQERFPETNVVRVFLYVYAGNDGLEGYTLRVTKDGVEQAVSGASFGGRPGLTWPIADDRQRFQNYKVEFPGVSPAGVWTVELLQGGAVVGPAATFTLEAGDTNQELYVRYARQ